MASATADETMISKWDSLSIEDLKTAEGIQERKELLQSMREAGVFPEAAETLIEDLASLFPDTRDPKFVEKLLGKREYAELKQAPTAQQIEQATIDPCDPEKEFELTPVQRFVANLLNPKTPYNSALLYHGVGVGKTCAAITIAEGFLEKYPRDQVIIVAPPNIQSGFERTIFDMDGLKIEKGLPDDLGSLDAMPNVAKGCTGNTYLKLTGTLFEQDRKVIESRVKSLIRRRYKLMGYTQFANEIENVEARVPRKAGQDVINNELRKAYSGKVIIIDEAHNLRDLVTETSEDNVDAAGGEEEMADAAAGKKLTPFLRRLLMATEGVTLVLLTGTPMYNSYEEIIFLLNLLILNEKRNVLDIRQAKTPEQRSLIEGIQEDEILVKEAIFDSRGNFREGGREKLGAVAGRYVSFMRGENPLTFPTRLPPLPKEGDIQLLTQWPAVAPNGKPVPGEERERADLFKLPIIKCYFEGPNAEDYKTYTEQVAVTGLGIQNVNTLIQAGNWIFPGDETIDERIRNQGFDNQFEARMEGQMVSFRAKRGDPTWLLENQIGSVSPKTKVLLGRLRTGKGCSFVYSRFVKSGALSIALALEANGYTLWGRERGFLVNKVAGEGGRQCARCPYKERDHRGAAAPADHTFIPAKYILLTGREEYSPDNAKAVTAQRKAGNLNGDDIKVVIGSQVASEGIDLRFIRELFAFDSWFHLNKLEQVIGRGIRTCSHSLFPDIRLRNTTVYLLVNAFPGDNMETMDLYSYRRAISKAVEVGRVTRVLKEYAIDCNLNHDAILVTGLEDVKMIDAQGNPRMANRNDIPYTALCDWEKCDSYRCKPEFEVNPLTDNEKTYTEFAAKWQEQKFIDGVTKLFKGRQGQAEQAFVTIEDFKDYFSDISKKALFILIQKILLSKSFFIVLFGKKGKIIYKNGYFLFQPLQIQDENIPLALRVSAFPFKRDSYEPSRIETTEYVIPQEEEAELAEEESTLVADTGAGLQLWEAIRSWTNSIRSNSPTANQIPTAVSKAIFTFHRGDEKLIRRSRERLEMVGWLFNSLKSPSADTEMEWKQTLADIVEESVWDEFLSIPDQMRLMDTWKAGALGMQDNRHIFDEQWLSAGSTTAFRFIDYRTGQLRHICGEKECTELQATLLEESPSNKLKDLQANVLSTGFLYGFLVPKKGELVFKNVNPVGVGKKVEKGQECSISSQVSDHLRKLYELGNAIRTFTGGATDFDLNEKAIEGEKKQTEGTSKKIKVKGPRHFENAVRACFLMDLLLRWMDRQNIERKRWMYRTISSYVTGHRGTYEKTPKGT